MTTYTDDDLIKRYLALRDRVQGEEEAFAERMKPYIEAMELVQNAMQAQLQERQANNTKTESGTAYLSTTVRPSVEDREALEAYARKSGDLSIFTNAVSKEAVEAYQEENEGRLPPGVKTTSITKCNIRRTAK